jgi:hypothetical protein
MTARKRPLSARLVELGEAVPAAQRRARECEVAHRRVVAEIARLTDAVADAYASSDEARAAKASKQARGARAGQRARSRGAARGRQARCRER